MSFAGVACFLTLVACAESPAPGPPLPETAAVTVGAEGIERAELEAVAAWFAAVDPAGTTTNHRRLALVDFLLPRAAVSLTLPEACARAEERCRARSEELRATPSDTPDETRTGTGAWREMGIDVWSRARALEPGRWSEPLRGVRAWYLIRRWPSDEESRGLLTVEIHSFPIEGAADVDTEAVIAEHGLAVLDDEVRPSVPLSYRTNAGGSP